MGCLLTGILVSVHTFGLCVFLYYLVVFELFLLDICLTFLSSVFGQVMFHHVSVWLCFAYVLYVSRSYPYAELFSIQHVQCLNEYT